MNRRTFLQQSLLTAAGLGLSTRPVLAGGWKESAPLPPLGSFGLEGSLPSLKGKVVYLDFWASWCAPCKASFPILNKWHQQLGGKGFTVLGINVDDKPEDMQGFLKKTPVSFPVMRDAAHTLVAAADVGAMPTAFLIDRKGIIRHVHNGFHKQDEASLAQQIATLLAAS